MERRITLVMINYGVSQETDFQQQNNKYKFFIQSRVHGRLFGRKLMINFSKRKQD